MNTKALMIITLMSSALITLSAQAAPTYKSKDYTLASQPTAIVSDQANITSERRKAYGPSNIASLPHPDQLTLETINSMPATSAGHRAAKWHTAKDYGIRNINQ